MVPYPDPHSSPTRRSSDLTSTQVAAVDQVPHRLVVNDEPVEMPVHHEPPCSQRPVTSSLPSPLKLPTLTSTQVILEEHTAEIQALKDVVLQMALDKAPPSSHRAL